MDHKGSYYQRDRDWHPPALTPAYKTSVLRAPKQALLSLDNTISEMTGPVFGHDMLGPLDDDLIRNWAKTGDAIGQRMIVHGRVLDENGRGLPGTLVEFWQANAGGRYRHHKETYHAALDPNFGGCGRCITGRGRLLPLPDRQARRLPLAEPRQRLAPGPHPFLAVRPRLRAAPRDADVFRGRPDDLAVPDRRHDPDKRAAIEQLVAALDRRNTTHMDSLAYRFDIVLRGRRSTPFENRMEGN